MGQIRKRIFAQSVKTTPEADTGLKVVYVDVIDYKGSLIQYTLTYLILFLL